MIVNKDNILYRYIEYQHLSIDQVTHFHQNLMPKNKGRKQWSFHYLIFEIFAIGTLIAQ